MGKLLDVIVLHFLWILCCLPVVTFGASTTALFYACMKEAEDKEGYYFRQFFKSFRQNLKQGSILGIIFLILEAGLIYSIYLCTVNLELNSFFSAIRVLSIILAVLVFITFEYAFPLLARFENSVLKTMQNGFLMSIQHIGWTIVMTGIFAGFYFLLFYFERYIFPLIILGFGLVVFICSFILNHILAPYIEMASQHDGMVSTDPDKWTVSEEPSEIEEERINE